ncbi:helix-turn-helix domain-containing protein [Pseudoclavibacter sp. VKM Ac-2867]|uniref:helix-turn-helix domain-containing protein n=1 Tax=Pseudoclavibacter sp. VKM Ac-2867 TaxID=2783829 RepID=UPI00188BAD1B|nr:helix-turn-helix domain-containing protein [Pseudoclavibacter sp. VKM Ac-2867]MBF4458361.1 helix-turn-helix domain-containing protein [Pseudoclavibacter sp. VKM Ac-2867]
MPTSTERPPTLDHLRKSSAATITRAEAAAVLGVDARTVTTAIANGTVPGIKIGRRVVIPREKFLALFDAEAA